MRVVRLSTTRSTHKAVFPVFNLPRRKGHFLINNTNFMANCCFLCMCLSGIGLLCGQVTSWGLIRSQRVICSRDFSVNCTRRPQRVVIARRRFIKRNTASLKRRIRKEAKECLSIPLGWVLMTAQSPV